jgi:crotonobetainyl-CoA:carnitine CoA-transferase CaiB-like acyl-CoA transferase
MFMSEYIMDAQVNGREGGRMGNRHPYRSPQGCYPALGDDRWITLSVGDDQGWADLCQLMGKPELASEPDFADLLSRQKNHDKIDEIIKEWTSSVDRYELMHALQGVGIPAGPVLNSKDVHYDPQFKSRGFLERVDYPKEREMGSRMFIGRPYKFSNSPLAIQGPSPTFGQHNEDILQGLLGVDSDTYLSLVSDAVIATVPTTGEASPRIPQEEALQRGRLADWDPDYLQNLGLV